MNPTGKIKIPNGTILDLRDNNAGYTVEVIGENLYLKNAAGTVISTAQLPGSLKVTRVDYEDFTWMVDGGPPRDNNSNILAFTPISYAIIGEDDKVIGRVILGSNLGLVMSIVNITNLPSLTLNANEAKAVKYSSQIAKSFNVNSNVQIYSLANYLYSPNFEESLSPNSPIRGDERFGIIRDEYNIGKAHAIEIDNGLLIINESSNPVSIGSTDKFTSETVLKPELGVYAVNFYPENDQSKVVYLASDSRKTTANDILTISGIHNADTAEVSVIDNGGTIVGSTTVTVTNNSININLTPITGTELNTIKIMAKATGADSQSLIFFVTCPNGYTASI